jgi:cell wall-associated NlpC family hydrolase
MLKTFAKISLAAALFSSCCASFAASTASAETVTLAQGMSGPDVSNLQRSLQTLGYFTYPSITGYFGPITAQAVRSFQQAYHLPSTGVDDAATQTSIAHALVKKKIIDDSYNYIGIPYDWGGTSPSTGFDCSGFVYYMFKTHGVPMNRMSSAQLYELGTWVNRSALRPGDLVFFSVNRDGTISHVGFYLGGNRFISATRSAGIFVQSLDSSYWGPRYMGAKRVY